MSKFRNLDARWRWFLVVVVGFLLLAAVDVWWVAMYRHNFPFDTDEYGYTAIGVRDWLGFKENGLHGWWEQVQSQTPNAPLLPAVTSVLLLVQPGVLIGFGTLIGFAAILVFSTYGIAEKLAGPRLGALAALAVATCQGAFTYSREYIFAMPAAAMLSLATLSLVRSDGLRSKRWSVVLGAAIGLMLLARTMTVAFIPGLVVAAVLLIATRWREDLGARLLNLLLAAVVAFGVTITWYWRNYGPVKDYLTNFGYGSQAEIYGTDHSPISWVRFKGVLERITELELLAPLTILVALGLIGLLIAAGTRLWKAEDRLAELVRLLGSNTFALAIVFALGYGALMSSANGGDGFSFPITVLLPPLAVVALRVYRHLIPPITVVVVLAAAITVVSSSTISDFVARQRNAVFPVLGDVPWTRGQPNAVGAVRTQIPGDLYRFEGDDAGYEPIAHELADLFLEPIGPRETVPLVAFASQNRVINPNSVLLAGLLDGHQILALTQLNGETDTVDNYLHELTAPEFGQPTVLVTMSSEAGDFPPIVTQTKAEAAARILGFHRIREFQLPDGRKLWVWVRKTLPSGRRLPDELEPSAPSAARGSDNRRGKALSRARRKG